MPLHFGRMPTWFTERMGSLSEAVIESVVQNYGKSEVLTRLSDPNWFQALGAVAGMQYNSSGVTDPPPLNWSTRYDSSGRTDNEYQTT